ncbi:MAG: hypothetical protein L7U62_07110 [Candidatus Poseidoniaceae archaeon]|nr:hypothetical protein [Candidatus Poseidoniaceae archaeon]
MGNSMTDGDSFVVYAQVGKAKANHCVELDTGFLRPKSFRLPNKVVYLGDVATHALSHLQHPETPHFSEQPAFNEQRWSFTTQSGALRMEVTSRSYWGFGLFNSGYLNRLTIDASPASFARLLFDLSASLSHRPWEFAHAAAATRFLSKMKGGITVQSNEDAWKHGLEMARAVFEEQLYAVEEQGQRVEKRVRLAQDNQHWSAQKANVAIDAAMYDLDIARGALADSNAPAFERAIARAEASFIEADPDTRSGLSNGYSDETPQGHILPIDAAEDEIAFVDLTKTNEEE